MLTLLESSLPTSDQDSSVNGSTSSNRTLSVGGAGRRGSPGGTRRAPDGGVADELGTQRSRRPAPPAAVVEPDDRAHGSPLGQSTGPSTSTPDPSGDDRDGCGDRLRGPGDGRDAHRGREAQPLPVGQFGSRVVGEPPGGQCRARAPADPDEHRPARQARPARRRSTTSAGSPRRRADSRARASARRRAAARPIAAAAIGSAPRVAITSAGWPDTSRIGRSPSATITCTPGKARPRSSAVRVEPPVPTRRSSAALAVVARPVAARAPHQCAGRAPRRADLSPSGPSQRGAARGWPGSSSHASRGA